MARWIAIDWDRCEARYVLAAARGSELHIETAGAIALLEEAATGAPQPADVGRVLENELARYDVRRAVGLLTLNRTQFELVQLTLPPCSDAELPEFVRNQTLQESVSVSDDAIIDYFVLGDDPSQPRLAVAVAAEPSNVARAVAACSAAGATARRLVVRPYATAALLVESLDDPLAPALALNIFPEDVDIILLAERRVAYWRTVRLPGVSESDETVQRLAAEIQRTVAVAQQTKLLPGPPASAWLFGSAEEQEALVQALADQLGMPLQVADPLALAGASCDNVPENLGRYAAPLAMIWAEARRAEPPIDLLHPKQTERPPVRWRMPALLGALLAIILGYSIYASWSELAGVERANDRLAARRRQLDESIRKAADEQQLAAALSQWQAADISWLDELRELSQRFPASGDLQIARLTLGAGRGGRGEVNFEGVVRAPQIVVDLAQGFVGPYYEFHTDNVQQREGQTELSWHFQASVSVAPRAKSAYLPESPSQP